MGTGVAFRRRLLSVMLDAMMPYLAHGGDIVDGDAMVLAMKSEATKFMLAKFAAATDIAQLEFLRRAGREVRPGIEWLAHVAIRGGLITRVIEHGRLRRFDSAPPTCEACDMRSCDR